MEVKKSPKADLEGKKSTWLLIGYVFILLLCLSLSNGLNAISR